MVTLMTEVVRIPRGFTRQEYMEEAERIAARASVAVKRFEQRNPPTRPTDDLKAMPEVLSLARKLKITFIHEEGVPRYLRTTDRQSVIKLPPLSSIGSLDAYHSALFHELVHWTGHQLDRPAGGEKGTRTYAMEELVAEMGAAMLCAHFKINQVPEHTSYLNSWLQHFEDKTAALIQASQAAHKAVAFLLKFER